LVVAVTEWLWWGHVKGYVVVLSGLSNLRDDVVLNAVET
jgi:hypothetical protein